MGLDDGLDDEEAEARAATQGEGRLPVALEDVGKVLGQDPGAVVPDHEPEVGKRRLALRCDDHISALGRLDRIPHEVLEHLDDAVAVAQITVPSAEPS